ncbi:MAG: glycoside hydrolase family 15 protein [Gammaproteobacteria bacterium]|nr:glycoside hydrolase family 15 protein [Gammaproteobacteria bacterium]
MAADLPPDSTRSLQGLGLVGNGQVSMLIDRSGAVVWGCWPRPDGDPLFSSLLAADDGASGRGSFSIGIVGQARSEIRYRRNTAILETTLEDDRGNALRVTDCCPRFMMYGRMFRPAMLIRQIEPLSGRPVVRIRVQPTEGYGTSTLAARLGSHHIRFVGTDQCVRLTTDAPLAYVADERPFVLDSRLGFLLSADDTLSSGPKRTAADFVAQTEAYWHDWVRGLAIPFEWQDAVIRAAITLKLCTYEDTGAVMAAMTTSIPEDDASARNWDYRYCWLRDGYFTVQALNRLGATRTMEGYLRYLDSLVANEAGLDLQPVYGLSGEKILSEWEAPGLPGFGGRGPVRVGNLAYDQPQHDVFGSIVLSSAQAFFDERLSSRGDRGRFERLEEIGKRATLLFEQADAGIWEFRGTLRRHTYSAAMCWAACDRLSKIADRLGMPERAGFWARNARDLGNRILSRAWHEGDGLLSASLDEKVLDASLLLLPEIGLVEWSDPRFRSTLAALERELVVDGFMMRYRHADDFGKPRNAFISCSFWWANALAATGRTAEARALFERLLAARNEVGLLSEHLDPRTKELWGNFPQTYSMVGIITTAMRLSSRWENAL